MPEADDTKITFSLQAVTVSRKTPDDYTFVEIAFRPWISDQADKVGPFDGIRITAHHRIGDEPSAPPQVSLVPFSGRMAPPAAHALVQGALRAMGLPEDALMARSRNGNRVVPQFSDKGIIWQGGGAAAVLALAGPLLTEDEEVAFAAAMMPDGHMIAVRNMTDLGTATRGGFEFWDNKGPSPAPGAPRM